MTDKKDYGLDSAGNPLTPEAVAKRNDEFKWRERGELLLKYRDTDLPDADRAYALRKLVVIQRELLTEYSSLASTTDGKGRDHWNRMAEQTLEDIAHNRSRPLYRKFYGGTDNY